MLPGLQDRGLHPLSGLVVQHRKGLGGHLVKEGGGGPQGESGIAFRAHGGEVGAHIDAPAGQDLLGNATSDAEGRRQAAGEVSTAPHVRLPAPLHPGGVVRMGGPGLVGKLAVIRGVLVAVLNDGAQRRAAGDALFQP